MRMVNSTPFKLSILSFLAVVYFSLSLNDLSKDVINPDGINWHTRTKTFINSLTKKHYKDTFQAYHPGTTLMWISGPLLNLFVASDTDNLTSEQQKINFLKNDFLAKLSLVTVTTLIFFATLLTLYFLVSTKYAFYYSILVILEPFVLGMRRMYHLDYLMTSLLFLSFLLLIYYHYKKNNWFILPLSAFFLVAAILTKTTAILLVPFIPFIFLLGNSHVLKKIIGLLLFVVSVSLFLYLLFPPIWRNPLTTLPNYYQKMMTGVSDIGIEGKKEIGTSGRSANVTLDDTLSSGQGNFYLVSLFMRTTPLCGIFLVISVSIYLYYFQKGCAFLVWKSIKDRKVPKRFFFCPESWLSFWSLGVSLAVFIALTLAVKKTDRYLILILPFLFTLIAHMFNKLSSYLRLPLLAVYLMVTILVLSHTHPYYFAYSNPLLGGLEMRLRTMDSAPFGVATYETMKIIKKDMLDSGYSGFYTISGNKSIKAISTGGRFSRFPSCVTDYVVAYAFEERPTYTCVQKYKLIGTTKVLGFDYWYIYKRENQLHQSDKD